jgi:hypothetical protein
VVGAGIGAATGSVVGVLKNAGHTDEKLTSTPKAFDMAGRWSAPKTQMLTLFGLKPSSIVVTLSMRLHPVRPIAYTVDD